MQVADVVFVKDGKVMLVQQRKVSAKGLWSYPGGRVEDEETPEQTVTREVKEELDIRIANKRFLKTYEITTPWESLL